MVSAAVQEGFHILSSESGTTFYSSSVLPTLWKMPFKGLYKVFERPLNAFQRLFKGFQKAFKGFQGCFKGFQKVF